MKATSRPYSPSVITFFSTSFLSQPGLPPCFLASSSSLS